jgi:NitT/TauT family transport system substrate-binding protein
MSTLRRLFDYFAISKRPAFLAVGIATALAALPGAVVAQGAKEVRIARIQGINFLPNYVMEAHQMVELQAKKLGLPDLAVVWHTVSSGGTATDALLAGSMDIVNVGPGNLLLLWDRTRGGVKGIVSNSALPATLISRDPKIRSISDFTPTDRIALPTVGVSTPALLLQMQAAKVFGADKWKQLDGNTVQLGHPDGYGALMNDRHEIKSHFTSPPFIARELKNVPGAHVVLTSNEVMGTPLSTAILFTTTKFATANPKLIEAVRRASKEAIDFIHSNPREAAQDYLKLSGDRMALDELVAHA